MKLISRFIICISTIIFTSCSLNIERKIYGSYYLISTDVDNDTNISVRLYDGNYLGKIPNQVVEYSLTSDFIFAKQQNYRYRTSKLENEVNYYILELSTGNVIKYGFEEFENFVKDENIKNLEWEHP
ncbi:MAG: hypothetical protein CMP13_16485 [Zunongwangia sp.]|uniref:Lipoprotein n=1 Tax=Zunongwangia profunda (strain DSM 18752 / CCTCC AB 206139 / SM-A87) TaxID=655815 RepID=D5BAY3_ZUNPS|nr:hypothetical protein [Zunongwangia profunda]ADF52496.1 hypothetical protein ZPR_2171 [Zunongwangia profunda SM-A87]MAS72192.1 hypothetical protein [Zunongwangia sp.]|tara:strand:- start:2048 stop:2428 length:381 start_codon:yes stop_codon:yes gene_type:complete